MYKPIRSNPANSNSTLPNATHPNKVASGKYLFHCAKDHHDVRAVSALLPGEALLSTLALGGVIRNSYKHSFNISMGRKLQA